MCRLPSFNAEFTASTPLTRIRDIAHRNDIPHELKQEIKHTIQVLLCGGHLENNSLRPIGEGRHANSALQIGVWKCSTID